MESNQDAEKLAAAKAAVKFVKTGDVVGLGTGSTATFAIKELGQMVQRGLSIKATSSSIQTEVLAKSFGINMISLGTLSSIDISIDGADEFTASLDLIKGGGGALFREKVMASLSRKRIIVTDASKKVEKLGKFTVPIEVVPLAYQYVFDQVKALGGRGIQRLRKEQPYLTDNGNFIIDADFGLIEKPAVLAEKLNQIEGLFAHGLFINLTSMIIMSKGGEVIIYE